jgi:hypothetical protein
MAQGFLVAELDEETNAPIKFWDGTTLQEDMQAGLLYLGRADARLVLGALQSQYPEKEMVLQPAIQSIQLTPPGVARIPASIAAATPAPTSGR